MNLLQLKKFMVAATVLLASTGVWAAGSASFDISLTPAGDFTGKVGAVQGVVKKNGSKLQAENIRINLAGLTTGIGLRDEHTRKHLEVDKYPEAILVKGIGENGKGAGILKIRNVERPIKFSYVTKGTSVEAEIKIKLSDFKFEGISYKGIGVDDDVTIHVLVPVK